MEPVSAVLITREAEYPKGVRLDFDFGELLIHTQCPNVLRRFELATKAKHDVIYVQDDDASIDIKKLWRAYDGTLTNALTLEHKIIYQGTGVTLIGWGCFFPRAMAEQLI